ncbi:putative Cullin 2 [Leptomonas pyrrhocoris]|uniref:Putative Cullin 2 n=1 Tax=Leptomonas pyrrhocoris TaxID=157538 RepID=A0A0N1J5C7_LEPPY|nr:putative Cullin 2 [Leptomonas pyrrhocoris]KPA85218.1 putative Cullin 2 [Leptomonas pyrrhocoris]|eukprot:XP_015663657.1 putative Cullin 2 [Leptomonas pyrrhocoris]
MTLCRDLDRSLNDLLIDSVSVPFDFPNLWKEVTQKCGSILKWESVFIGENGPQEMCNTVMDAYVLVYHLISHPCSNTPLVKVNGKEIWEGQQIMAVYSLQGAIFEQHLLNNVITAFGQEDDIPTIQTYVRLWRSFLVAVVNIKTVFSSLADKWSLLGLEENPLDRTEDIALRKWSTIVLTPHVVSQLRRELRALLAGERAGGCAPDLSFAVEIKDELSMLPDSNYYRSIVEVDYIRDMCEHSWSKARSIAESDLFEYAKVCLDLIEEELIRAGKFLTNKDHAVDRLVETLVDDHINLFQVAKVSEWHDAAGQPEADLKLQTLFRLLWWSKGKGAPLMEGIFKDSVARCTAAQLSKAVQTAAEVADTYAHIIESFALIVKKYRNVVRSVFGNNGCMLEAMDEGLHSGFVNMHSVNFKKLADRLAALSNSILGKSGATKLQMEDIISVYYFLPDAEIAAKDTFLVSYQAHLAKRLLLHHYDDKREQRAMEQLVQVKQSPILFCCRSMLKTTRNHSIYIGASTTNHVLVNPALLSRGTWPSVPHSVATSGIPPACSHEIEIAKERCMKMRHGQKIDFSAPYSCGVVRMQLPPGTGSNRTTVQLKLSFVQICIVDRLNIKTEWGFRELCDALKVNEGDCLSALTPLVKATVVQLDGAPGPACKVSLGRCNGLVGDVVDLMPLEFHAFAQSAAVKLREQRAPPNAARANPQRLESQVVHLLKQNGALAAEELLTLLTAAMVPLTVPRGELKRVLEKLIERGLVVRDGTHRKFSYSP